MRKNMLFTLAVLPLLILTANAQLSLPGIFKQPIEQALSRNKEIANKLIELEKSGLERKSVLSKYVPRLEATAGYAYFDNHISIDLPGLELPVTGAELFSGKTTADNRANIANAGLLAKSVLFSGMQIQNGAKAMQQKMTGDSLLMEADKDHLIIEVIAGFDQLKYLQVSQELITDSDHRLLKEEERVNKAIENGLAVPFDRDKIKLARLELESQRALLEESQSLLFHKLQYLTGMMQPEIQNVVYELNPIILAEDLHVNNKQELKALRAYKNASAYMLKKERGSFLPQAAAFAGVSYLGLFHGSSSFHLPDLPQTLPQPEVRLNSLSLAPNWIAGVQLKWEIFGGNERRYKVKTAELNIKQLDNKLADSREKLDLLLLQKKSSYYTQGRQIELAVQQEQVAKNSLNLAEKQYINGLISISQRLEAENDYVKAGRHKTEALIRQRQAALEAIMATGILSGQIQFQ